MSNVPATIKGIFDELNTEVVWLHLRWKMYRQLFAESPKRIDLLNECAAAFFYVIEDVLIGEVQIMLSKLTDAAKTGRHDNLSLERLQEGIEALQAPALAQRMAKILASLKQKCAPFRVWRNKKLAHLDLTTAMRSVANPLPGVSRQMIEEALELVRQYLNCVHGHYDDTEMAYEHLITAAQDAEGLVAVLKQGLRYDELVQQNVIGHEDWNQNPWHDA